MAICSVASAARIRPMTRMSTFAPAAHQSSPRQHPLGCRHGGGEGNEERDRTDRVDRYEQHQEVPADLAQHRLDVISGGLRITLMLAALLFAQAFISAEISSAPLPARNQFLTAAAPAIAMARDERGVVIAWTARD